MFRDSVVRMEGNLEWMLVCSKEEKLLWLEEEDILATSWGWAEEDGSSGCIVCHLRLRQDNSDGKTSKNGRNGQKLRRIHKMWVTSIDFTFRMFIFQNTYVITVFRSPYYSI